MAIITIAQLRERCVLEAEGVGDSEIEEAIGSAVEEVTGLVGPAEGSMLVESAIANYAHADVLDIIIARDGRADEDEPRLLRKAAERKILSYLQVKQSDGDPTTDDVPPIIVTNSGPNTLQVVDETY